MLMHLCINWCNSPVMPKILVSWDFHMYLIPLLKAFLNFDLQPSTFSLLTVTPFLLYCSLFCVPHYLQKDHTDTHNSYPHFKSSGIWTSWLWNPACMTNICNLLGTDEELNKMFAEWVNSHDKESLLPWSLQRQQMELEDICGMMPVRAMGVLVFEPTVRGIAQPHISLIRPISAKAYPDQVPQSCLNTSLTL